MLMDVVLQASAKVTRFKQWVTARHRVASQRSCGAPGHSVPKLVCMPMAAVLQASAAVRVLAPARILALPVRSAAQG
jgi:hypothetical protein